MPQIRIRTPFAAAFVGFILVAAYLGLTKSPVIPSYGQSDKGLHFVTFFILTLIFYWILETSRRRIVHITLLVCTAGLAIGSEVVQHFVPNDRVFDPFDILANVLGSTIALLLCSWYHKRMLERRRKNKHYDIVPGEDVDEDDQARDIELGEGPGLSGQETGRIHVEEPDAQAGAGAESNKKTVTEELDNWDENAEDWEDGADANGSTDASKTVVDGDLKKLSG